MNGRHGRDVIRSGARRRELDRHQRLAAARAPAAWRRAAADRAAGARARSRRSQRRCRRELARSAEARQLRRDRGALPRRGLSEKGGAAADRKLKRRREPFRGLGRREQERALRPSAPLHHKGRNRSCRAWHRPPRRTVRRPTRSAGAARAITVKLSVPNNLAPVTSAKPRAAAMAMRTPVKLPGPIVAAIRSSSASRNAALLHHLGHHRHQRLGMAARHQASRKTERARAPSTASSAAEQAPMLVSSARMFIGGVLDDLRHLVEVEARRARKQHAWDRHSRDCTGSSI